VNVLIWEIGALDVKNHGDQIAIDEAEDCPIELDDVSDVDIQEAGRDC